MCIRINSNIRTYLPRCSSSAKYKFNCQKSNSRPNQIASDQISKIFWGLTVPFRFKWSLWASDFGAIIACENDGARVEWVRRRTTLEDDYCVAIQFTHSHLKTVCFDICKYKIKTFIVSGTDKRDSIEDRIIL